MKYIGIDIGSTCAKMAVFNEEMELLMTHVQPTGWSSIDTAEALRHLLEEKKILLEDAKCVATGYGRVAVPFANKSITEITCHGKGAQWLSKRDSVSVIDIGGQDTKIIQIEDGMVTDFIMNDKCSAGTGRFLEVMGNTLSLRPGEVCELAKEGSNTTISSMCTVFAESEVISLIGRGESKANIAYAIVDSIVSKVASQSSRLKIEQEELVYLTGGLCECDYLCQLLAEKLKTKVVTSSDARFAGAIGAAILASKLK